VVKIQRVARLDLASQALCARPVVLSPRAASQYIGFLEIRPIQLK
jgi:hypothetical protein